MDTDSFIVPVRAGDKYKSFEEDVERRFGTSSF